MAGFFNSAHHRGIFGPRIVRRMPFQTPFMVVGVSARIYHPSGPVLDLGGVWTKTLHYLEQSVAHWLIAGGALPVMIPAVDAQSVVTREELHLGHYADALDALVLQGGNDVAPETYGQTPLNAAWPGDAVRDAYEMALIHAFVRAGKPVFGICRGLQLINVAFGGTLWQDIKTQQPLALDHVKVDLYERNIHPVEIVPNTHLASLYPQLHHAHINSIHHQAIRDLAPGFTVEARCPSDGIVEAIRQNGPSFVAGVQWHPEFRQNNQEVTFNDTPLLQDFLQAARVQKLKKHN